MNSIPPAGRSNPTPLHIPYVEFKTLVDELPKVELHTHVEGIVRPQTILDLAKEKGLPPPAASVSELKDKIGMKPGENLLDFLKKFDCFRFVFDDKASLERIGYEAIEDNARRNVIYTELRMNPLKHPDKVSVGDTIDAVLAGMRKACEHYHVKAGFIVSLNRSYGPESAMEVAKEAVKRKDAGVVGLDLAGDEVHYPAEQFEDVFRFAHEHGLKATVHAGEAVGPASIRGALDSLHADRIGHGVRLDEDPQTEKLIEDEHIPLELAPTSNRQLNVVKNMAKYPLREYLEEGIKVTVNTDDKAIFGSNLTDEYMKLARYTDLSLGDVETTIFNAVGAAFLPTDEKTALGHQAFKAIQAINEKLQQAHPGADPHNTFVATPSEKADTPESKH